MKKFMEMVRSRAWWGVVARVIAGVMVHSPGSKSSDGGVVEAVSDEGLRHLSIRHVCLALLLGVWIGHGEAGRTVEQSPETAPSAACLKSVDGRRPRCPPWVPDSRSQHRGPD